MSGCRTWPQSERRPRSSSASAAARSTRNGLGRGHGAAARPPCARLLRGRGRARAAARPGHAGGGAADPRPLADAPPRRARARARAVAHGRHLRVHHGRARPGALRRRLPRDARARGLRPGRVPGAARLHGRRGLEARAAARRCSALRLRRAAPGAQAYPVVRLAATTPGAGSAVLSPTVLGMPAAAVRRLHWRSDFSSLPLVGDRAEAVGAGRAPAARRAVPGRDGDALGARTTARAGRARLGRGRGSLAEGSRSCRSAASTRREATLKARVPREPRLRVLGIQLALPESEAFMLAHDEAEGSVPATPVGRDRPSGRCTPTAAVLTDWRDWTLSTGGDVLPRAGGATIRYAFPDIGLHLVFRPRAADRRAAMPVVVSPTSPAPRRDRRDHRARLPGHARRRPDRRSGVAAALRSRRQRRVRPRRRAPGCRPRSTRTRPARARRTRSGSRRRTTARSPAGAAPAARSPALVVDVACSDRATPRRRPAGARDRNRAGRSWTGRARAGRARLLGRRRQRAARREERLLRPRGPGTPSRRHAPAAAHARRDPARRRLRRRPGAGAAALAPRRLPDPGVGHDRRAGAAAAARSRLARRRSRDRCADAGRAARRRGGLARRLPRQPARTRRPGAST